MARRKKTNEQAAYSLVTGTATIGSGTADGDAVTTLAMPSEGYIGHSALQVSSGGTGTALITAAWYSAAARGGTKLSDAHSPVIDLDVSGTFHEAEGIQPTTLLVAAARLFLNMDFDGGTATGAASLVGAINLVL